MIRFETKKETHAITLTKIVDACLKIANTEATGIVMVAESAGLMGAALRQSPALHTSDASLFEHPGIQDWLGKEPLPAGHFHTAVFSYRPLKKGEMDLKTTVSTLFESETLQAVLHLLNDDREIAGAGQSEFVRGACWVGPISEVITGRI